jgi:hypothetical protein
MRSIAPLSGVVDQLGNEARFFSAHAPVVGFVDDAHRQRSLPQSSSASPRTAGAFGFFILTRSRHGRSDNVMGHIPNSRLTQSATGSKS